MLDLRTRRLDVMELTETLGHVIITLCRGAAWRQRQPSQFGAAFNTLREIPVVHAIRGRLSDSRSLFVDQSCIQ